MNQQSSQRPLEEVLRDPSANWDEIRCAIKGQGSRCTNVAIMQALSTEQSWANATIATAIVMKEEEKQQQQQQQKVDQNNEGESNNLETVDDSANEVEDKVEVVSTPLPIDDDLKESLTSIENDANNIKSSFRRGGRGRRSSSGLVTSSRRTGRRRGSRRNSGSILAKTSFKESSASINIMDFGVVEGIESSDSNNFNESSTSDNMSKSGFMGWKHHDDISVRSSYTHDRSFQRDGSDEDSIILSEGDVDDLKESFSSFSSLVDSSGFLDWRHSVRRRSSGDDDGEGEVFFDWSHSFKRRPGSRSSLIDTVDEVDDELSCTNEDWNIDDYDAPDNGLHTSNHTPMSALTNRLKLFGSTRRVEIDRQEDIAISEIQQALLNVRKVESNNTEQERSTSRRTTICGDPDTANQANNSEGMTKPKRTRRKTVIGNVAMLGAMFPVPISNTKSNDESLEDNQLGTLSDANEPKKKAPHRRRITIMDGISPFVGIRKDQAEKTADFPTHDDRKAIWISREDGNVDIERECRKLYGDIDASSTVASN